MKPPSQLSYSSKFALEVSLGALKLLFNVTQMLYRHLGEPLHLAVMIIRAESINSATLREKKNIIIMQHNGISTALERNGF